MAISLGLPRTMVWILVVHPDLALYPKPRTVLGADAHHYVRSKVWNKILVPVLYGAIFLWLLFTAFDAGRFHWLSVPRGVEIVGAFILGASFVLFFLTFRANSYLWTIIRVQEERGQVVITTGAYRFVRHPMYAATLVFFVGTPLLLGAWYGDLPSPIVAIVLAWRAFLEEKTLQKDLQGYDEYMTRPKYRLIPFVW